MQKDITSRLNSPIDSRALVACAVKNGIAPYLASRVLDAVNSAREELKSGSSKTSPTNAHLLALSFHGADVTRFASTSYWGVAGLGKRAGELIFKYLEEAEILQHGVDYRDRYAGSSCVSRDFILKDSPELD